jgi:selenide,water dikinase
MRSGTRRLVLAGGGHAHVHVLRTLARIRPSGVEVTLVSPERVAIYTGMIPGRLARLYAPEEVAIDVAALAARAGATFLADRVVALHPAERSVDLALRGPLPYDVLSLDVGARPAGSAAIAGWPHVVPIKPIEDAIRRIDRFVASLGAGEATAAVVVGAGAGGVEVAFALRRRLPGGAATRVTLVERGPAPLPDGAPRLQRLVARLAQRHGIELRPAAGDVTAEQGGVRLGDGTKLEAPLVVWATGAEGHPFVAASGLRCDERGFLLVDDELRSVDEPSVFAAGDCSLLATAPWVPRAGVYAVRQGPVLGRNVVRAATGAGRLARYRPQRRFLSLLSTGDRRAVLSRGAVAAHGRVWWWLKDAIDRRFVAAYAPPRAGALRAPMAGRAMEPCGGCAAKVDAEVLRDVVAAVAPGPAPGVALGLEAPDDGAVLRHPDGHDAVVTVDAFPPFLDDPRTVGEIAAVNAASDVYAMGGEPTAALALIALPAADRRGAAAELRQVLDGACDAFARMGVTLAGGHSVAADARLVGFTVHGIVERGRALTKAGAAPGDALVLTKPLGTGVVLAAARAGECPAAWVDAALAAMRETNARAARALRACEVRCCTDVSGFGLAGHLRELLDASAVGARVFLDAVPALPGALELLAAGWRSSAQESLEGSLAGADVAADADPARVALLCDPQTSGGLLAALPEAALARLAVPHWRIGEVTDEARALCVARGRRDGARLLASPGHGV